MTDEEALRVVPKPPKKEPVPLYVISLIMMLLLIYLRVGGTGLSASYHSTPLPERSRITGISQSDPAIVALKAFADERKLRWEMAPDKIDGTDYCAVLDGAVSCHPTIGQASSGVIEAWKSRKIAVGSK